MNRSFNRSFDQLRPIRFTEQYLSHPAGSVLAEAGATRVICAVSATESVPPWMKAQKVPGGWLTCEYSLLPSSTGERSKREINTGRPSGRTMEIQRLIGRSLRNCVDLEKLGEITLYADCDVIDADGGTRCDSITGASLALELAIRGKLGRAEAFRERIAAVSVGIVHGEVLLDLDYQEDSQADVDMNVVMTQSGKFVEIQGTSEGAPFERKRLDELLALAEHGIRQIFAAQQAVVDRVLSGGEETQA
ncbi:MAG: ribonuclease PH [Victivallaceae bacterium]|nr:ribonuclease PH [Victivallaceae bacterium]